MIPKIIHYCWFGGGEMPQLAKECIASWHKYMPDWEYKLWNEDNFDVNCISYVKEAYEAKKFAFVSDYVRLFALYSEGGIYLDTDVEVFKSFSDVLSHQAFIGYEGSKHLPLGTCVIGSAPEGKWIGGQIRRYQDRHFIDASGQMDTTTNVQFITADMIDKGLICDGRETDLDGIHIFPVDYFSPRRTTGEYIVTENTYCDHHFMGSWSDGKNTVSLLLKIFPVKWRVGMIKLKRKILG